MLSVGLFGGLQLWVAYAECRFGCWTAAVGGLC